MAQEQVEEYLEAIYDIAGVEGTAKTTAIAKCLKVAPASVTEALQNLADKNLVNYEPYRGASLTGEGKKIAETIKRRHRLLEVFLADVLHINRATCTTKHAGWSIRSRKTLRTRSAGCSMPRRTAPTGALLPPAQKGSGVHRVRCGHGSAVSLPEKLRATIVPITELGPDDKGKIAFIRGDCKIVQRLSDLGLTLGTTVSVTRKAPLNGR